MKRRKFKNKVNDFYSIGARRIEIEGNEKKHFSGGFISFGYWENNEKNYVKAAEKLLDFFITEASIKNPKKILNVACGYGEETFQILKKTNPEEITGIDITESHVDYANYVANKMNLQNVIKFLHGDAVELKDFPDNSFSHILGIEGPAHFNTREKFFQSAHRVLAADGELIITDIILGNNYTPKNIFFYILVRLACYFWKMPIPNRIHKEKVLEQLKTIGFEIINVKLIGDKVFPGYSGSFAPDVLELNHKTKRMGLFYAFSFTFIGKYLGYIYNKSLIDYIFIHARIKNEI